MYASQRQRNTSGPSITVKCLSQRATLVYAKRKGADDLTYNIYTSRRKVEHRRCQEAHPRFECTMECTAQDTQEVTLQLQQLVVY